MWLFCVKENNELCSSFYSASQKYVQNKRGELFFYCTDEKNARFLMLNSAQKQLRKSLVIHLNKMHPKRRILTLGTSLHLSITGIHSSFTSIDLLIYHFHSKTIKSVGKFRADGIENWIDLIVFASLQFLLAT